jgi:hypothetical protein
MLVFLIDNIIVVWWTCFSTDSRHSNWYQLFSSSRRLVPSCEADFIQGLLKKNEKNLPNPLICWRLYPIDLLLKDTTDIVRSASFRNLHLEIDSDSLLKTKFYDKRDDFNFFMVNFPFIFLSWSGIKDLMIPVMLSVIKGCCYEGSYWT